MKLMFVVQGFSEQALKEVEGMEARISQREKDIKLIAKSITELAEIFKDLNTLVIDQVYFLYLKWFIILNLK